MPENILAKRPAKTIIRDGEWAIKIFDAVYPASDVLQEAMMQARAGESGLPVPVLDSVRKTDGKWSIVMEYIEGETLESRLCAEPEKAEEYMNSFICLQKEMHKNKNRLLVRHKEKMHRKIDETSLDATIRYELHSRLNGMPEKTSILHGDFTPGNVILRPDGKWYLLDWAHATQGDPAADIASSYQQFLLSDMPDRAEDYLYRICREEDIPRQTVGQWMPIVAAARSVKAPPEQQPLLHKWLDVIEFQ